jgi:Predicted transcriptional regulator
MQINRLFGIVYLLMDKKKVTTKQLAEYFEVSTRTIYRDLDILSGAGIPVYTSKGKGGGIRLLDEFVLNKSILSEQEQNEILISLQSMNAAQYPEARQVLDKLCVLFNKSDTNWIEVDFSHWGSAKSERNKFTLLKNAIINTTSISFRYSNSAGEKMDRTVEPLKLFFKGQGWYLLGFCRVRNDYRMFKIKRMKNLQINDETFQRTAPTDILNEEDVSNQPPIVTLLMKIEGRFAYRVYDEFAEESIVENTDGSFNVTFSVPEDEWIYAYILSYGPGAEVIEPQRIRKIITQRLYKILDKYS